jgi:hypothetical protein
MDNFTFCISYISSKSWSLISPHNKPLMFGEEGKLLSSSLCKLYQVPLLVPLSYVQYFRERILFVTVVPRYVNFPISSKDLLGSLCCDVSCTVVTRYSSKVYITFSLCSLLIYVYTTNFQYLVKRACCEVRPNYYLQPPVSFLRSISL